MPDLSDEGLPYIYTLTTPKGYVHRLASDNWREILSVLYLSVSCACDDLTLTSVERGNVFADLPGGLEPPQGVSMNLFEAYMIEVEVRL